ncbi:alkaline phosphatase [Paenibacillus daejeonensis]|uniref:alkaline phosphatase n=1 Tax=Paenibacillus daejeonensis TaxID=135193 RepID=UPI000370557F|nr:alkaline phosphatase [Paenibacillus daejeonensis]
MKQWITKATAVCLTVGLLASGGFAGGVEAAEKGSAKNVILLIPDGMGISYLTATRIFKGEELSFERYVKGLMKTYSADTNITDSAAAGTAMATGYKTNNGVISVTPDGGQPDSILDASREKGKSTGLVATSRITHATPAVFAAHDPSRGNEPALALDYINNVDVILGGGRDMFLPVSEGGRQEERNLVAEAQEAGYDYITNRSELGNVTSDKVLGLFGMSDLKYEIDRDLVNTPSLAEMTDLAIDVLSKNDEGFFLMVEGSQIDWAGHANDPVALIHDMLAFEDAVDVALEYAKADGETLVVVVGDHETGGLNIGNTPGGYAENISVLSEATGSANAVRDALLSAADVVELDNVRTVNGEHYVPTRQWVDKLGGSLEYHAATNLVDINIDNVPFTLNLPEQTIVAGNNVIENGYITDNGTAYMNVRIAADLMGVQAGIATSQDTPGTIKAHLVDIKAVAEPITGLTLTDADLRTLTSVNWANAGNISNEVGTVYSAHALVSWGTRHHSGEELPVYAYGVGAEHFVGLINNTDLPRIMSYVMGTELFEGEQAFIDGLKERREQ